MGGIKQGLDGFSRESLSPQNIAPRSFAMGQGFVVSEGPGLCESLGANFLGQGNFLQTGQGPGFSACNHKSYCPRTLTQVQCLVESFAGLIMVVFFKVKKAQRRQGQHPLRLEPEALLNTIGLLEGLQGFVRPAQPLPDEAQSLLND